MKTKAKVKTKAKAPATSKIVSRPDLDEVAQMINAKMKSRVCRPASEIESLYLLRRPTGITSLDIELAGGFPASSTGVIVGPDGAGKDLLLWRICAETQKVYGDDFRMVAYFTEFRPDKIFMRTMCGLKIAFTPEEIEEYDRTRQDSGLEPLTEAAKNVLTTEVGKIFIITGETADTAFDAIMQFVESNTCQLICINSIGFLQTEAKEAVDSFADFAQQSNEAVLISKFMPKLAMTLNNDRNGRNETTLLIVNQVRAKRDKGRTMPGRPPQERDNYQAGAGAYALKHGKAIELMIHKGPKHYDEVTKTVMGRKVPWSIDKGKLGTHDGLKGEFDFFYDEGIDFLGDLYNCCLQHEVFEMGGAWVTYDHPEYGFRLMGKGATRRHILETEGLYDHLREACFHKAGVVYRFR